MHVPKDLKHLVAKILANNFDYDSENLFPPKTPMENMEDAAAGVFQLLPKRTLRENQYKNMPLILRPDYSGDFLEKLEKPYEGKRIEASDEENLLDFDMPADMLKHQEEPHPRDLRDDFYEMARPEDRVLKDYWDRAWDNQQEAPEISEDLLTRCRPFSKSAMEDPCLDPSHVVANFLMDSAPYDALIDTRSPRTAALLRDLEKTKMMGPKGDKERGKRVEGIRVIIYKEEPDVGRFIFRTSSGSDIYTTIFQFIPRSNIRELSKLQVRVSCSCPAWLFWGAQFNAQRHGYLYGPVRLKFAPPNSRDPLRQHLVCKHVLASIPEVLKKRLGAIPAEVSERIKAKPPIRIKKETPESIKIPKDLEAIGYLPRIQGVVDKWNDMSSQARKSFILKLNTPDEVAYFAHRFPETATRFVIQKLTDMTKMGPTEKKSRALELMQDLGEAPKEAPEKEPADVEEVDKAKPMRPEFRPIMSWPEVQKANREWSRMRPQQREDFINELEAPRAIAYMAYKFPNTASEYVIQKLTDISKEHRLPSTRNEAKKYLGILI